MNTHSENRIDNQQCSSERPSILDRFRKRFLELTLAPLENDEEFGGDGGEQDPNMLAHSDRASESKGEVNRSKNRAED